MAIFTFDITEPGKSAYQVRVGPHETAYSAKRAIEHGYPEGTKIVEADPNAPAPVAPVPAKEESPAPTPAVTEANGTEGPAVH